MKLIYFLFVLVLLKNVPLEAQDGSLDLSFGNNGSINIDEHSYKNIMAIQADGKIVSATAKLNFRYDFSISRFNLDGTLDTSFGNNGNVLVDFDGLSDYPAAIIIQNDGKILIAGTSDDNGISVYYSIVRLHNNGTFDNTFGGMGKVLSYTNGSNLSLGSLSIALQNDFKIVLSGVIIESFISTVNHDFKLIRFNSDGTVDNSFGSWGSVRTDFTGNHYNDFVNSLSLQSDGKIIQAGYTTNIDNSTSSILIRYNNNGSLDSTFGVFGKVKTDVGSSNLANLALIQNDGKILVAGSITNTNGVIFSSLSRYNNGGTIDNSFGSGGHVKTNMGTENIWSLIAIQNDNKIVAVGHAGTPFSKDFTMARFHSNGEIDLNFGDSGKVYKNFDQYDFVSGLALQVDGKILTSTYNYNTSSVHKTYITRYLSNGVNEITENINQSLCTVYPNPLAEQLNISFTEVQENCVIKLIDNLGKEINHYQFSGKDFVLSKGTLQSGVYFIEITDKNKNVSIEKIVVN